MRARTAFLVAAFVATPALADPPQSILTMQQAYQASEKVARQVPGVTDLVITPLPYEVENHRWVTLFKPNTGEGFIVILNEQTGEICALYEHHDDCAAKGSARPELDAVKARELAREDAKLHPPPDMEGLWVVILESLVAKDTAPPKEPRTWYLTVSDTDGKTIDPPPSVLAKARLPGVQLLPGSKAPPPDQKMMMGPMRYGIGLPLKRPDGNYEVTYGSYCGPLCASGNTLVMSHDAAGWHIVSQRMDWVS